MTYSIALTSWFVTRSTCAPSMAQPRAFLHGVPRQAARRYPPHSLDEGSCGDASMCRLAFRLLVSLHWRQPMRVQGLRGTPSLMRRLTHPHARLTADHHAGH